MIKNRLLPFSTTLTITLFCLQATFSSFAQGAKPSSWLVLTHLNDDTYEGGGNQSALYFNKANNTIRITADLATLASPASYVIDWQKLPDPTFELNVRLPNNWLDGLSNGLPASYELPATVKNNDSTYPISLFLTLYPDAKTKSLRGISIEWKATPQLFGWTQHIPQLSQLIEIDWNDAAINWEEQ